MAALTACLFVAVAALLFVAAVAVEVARYVWARFGVGG